MRTQIQVLSEVEHVQIHERSLKLLATTGVRVLSARGRKILKDAGAEVEKDSLLVRFPRTLIEQSLDLAPKKFKLGGRRPGWDIEMNAGKCTLLADGGAVSVLDWESGEIIPGTFDDWLAATHLIDVLDEIGVYWNMVEGGFSGNSLGDFVSYWRNVLKNCSKHIQDSTDSVKKSKLLLEILQIAFGNKETIRQTHPFSYLLCPMSPLVIDEAYTDAYLETIGYDIPAAIMPMPLMGTTGPASMISTMLTANSEALAMLCLVQSAAPETPVLYAPIPQTIEPHTWRYTGGAVENSLFGAAVAEMGRYYGLPVEGSTGGTDQYYPGAQASYERAINWALPTVAWPDILVGPGLLGGSTILCLEQMVMDVEIFRRLARLHEGINTESDKWLEETIAETGPGGNFLTQKSTLKAVREGIWYFSEMGFHGTYEKWKADGMPDIIDVIQGNVKDLLKDYQPLPLDSRADRELERLERKTRESNR
ncbi:MAG: trimethylamine methyltransferase family protein [Anaerolineales bacterium]|jgi:trimethylamine--corrinoid protein Co-methyltransferase